MQEFNRSSRLENTTSSFDAVVLKSLLRSPNSGASRAYSSISHQFDIYRSDRVKTERPEQEGKYDHTLAIPMTRSKCSGNRHLLDASASASYTLESKSVRAGSVTCRMLVEDRTEFQRAGDLHSEGGQSSRLSVHAQKNGKKSCMACHTRSLACAESEAAPHK